jgi:hypothetical protein
MRKLLLTLFLSAAALPALAGGGFGYDAQGRYHQWFNTPQGGFGYDTHGQYYQWYNAPDGRGGFGYDGNGQYFQWYNN